MDPKLDAERARCTPLRHPYSIHLGDTDYPFFYNRPNLISTQLEFADAGRVSTGRELLNPSAFSGEWPETGQRRTQRAGGARILRTWIFRWQESFQSGEASTQFGSRFGPTLTTS